MGGDKLVDLMYEYNVGIQVQKENKIKNNLQRLREQGKIKTNENRTWVLDEI